MRRLHHFVLTNFNVRIDGVTTDRCGQPVQTREWLDGRVVLFETFCLPSMAGQTCPRFEWLMCFDSETPADVRQRIRCWQQSVNLTPVWDESRIDAILAERVGSGPSLVLTTRLDSDDGLQKDFVAVMQGEAEAARAEILCPTYGYSVQYPEGVVRQSRDTLSAFITLVDPVTGPPTRTVRSVPHRDASGLAPPRAIGQQPLWLQTAHGGNLWNRPHGTPCAIAGVREAFNLGPDVPLRAASD